MISKRNFISYFLISIIGVILLTLNILCQDVSPLSSLKDLESLKDSKKGKTVLVNFWATWCKPCVSEFPELVKLYNDYKDKGFEIIFISVDVPENVKQKVVPFLKNKGVDFTTYYDNFEKPEDIIDFFDKNWEGAIPSTYIYDKEWNQKTKFIGSRTYQDFENEILKIIN
jgi:thiol-disulfide isomerase/thioredoxin